MKILMPWGNICHAWSSPDLRGQSWCILYTKVITLVRHVLQYLALTKYISQWKCTTKMSFVLSIWCWLGCKKYWIEFVHPMQWVTCWEHGKGVARDACVTFIVDAALNALILRSVLNAPLQWHLNYTRKNDNGGPDIAETADIGNKWFLDEDHIHTREANDCRYVCRRNVFKKCYGKIKNSHKKNVKAVKNSPDLQLCGLSAWAWFIAYANSSWQSIRETWHRVTCAAFLWL